jgi:hypothetical protein
MELYIIAGPNGVGKTTAFESAGNRRITNAEQYQSLITRYGDE